MADTEPKAVPTAWPAWTDILAFAAAEPASPNEDNLFLGGILFLAEGFASHGEKANDDVSRAVGHALHELASEVRLTHARSFDELLDRREVLTRQPEPDYLTLAVSLARAQAEAYR